MKKTLLPLILILLSAATAFADIDGDVSLGGAVKEQFWLKLPLVEEYKGEIAVSGMTQWEIGTVVMTSNIKHWTISVESKNGGQKPGFLANQEDSSETIPYTFSLGTLTPKRAELPWKSLIDCLRNRTTPKKFFVASIPLESTRAASLSIYFTPDDATFYETGVYIDILILTISRK